MDTKSLTKALLLLVVCVLGQARAQDDNSPIPLPITNANSAGQYKPPSLAQQRAMYEAEQRMLRMEWRAWTNQSPLRPTINASFMGGGYQSYYIPQRGILVNSGYRNWYW